MHAMAKTPYSTDWSSLASFVANARSSTNGLPVDASSFGRVRRYVGRSASSFAAVRPRSSGWSSHANQPACAAVTGSDDDDDDDEDGGEDDGGDDDAVTSVLAAESTPSSWASDAATQRWS
jgi:hypothetical protein